MKTIDEFVDAANDIDAGMTDAGKAELRAMVVARDAEHAAHRASSLVDDAGLRAKLTEHLWGLFGPGGDEMDECRLHAANVLRIFDEHLRGGR